MYSRDCFQLIDLDPAWSESLQIRLRTVTPDSPLFLGGEDKRALISLCSVVWRGGYAKRGVVKGDRGDKGGASEQANTTRGMTAGEQRE